MTCKSYDDDNEASTVKLQSTLPTRVLDRCHRWSRDRRGGLGFDNLSLSGSLLAQQGLKLLSLCVVVLVVLFMGFPTAHTSRLERLLSRFPVKQLFGKTSFWRRQGAGVLNTEHK